MVVATPVKVDVATGPPSSFREIAVTRPEDAASNMGILKTQKKCSNIPTSAWESDYMKVIVLVEACLADFIQKAGLHLGKRIASRVIQMTPV